MKKYWKWALVLFYMLLLISYGCVRAFRYSLGSAKIVSNKSFTFFITSDLHHFSKKLYDNGKAFKEFLATGDGKLLQYSDELLDALTGEVRLKKPDFLIVTGDLTCNGERESHLELVEKLKAIEDLGTSVFVVPGNHDIENPWAKRYIGDKTSNTDSISSDEYLRLYDAFGYDEAVSRDPDSLSYLAMPAEDVWLLMLNSSDYNNNYKNRYPEQGGCLSPQTLQWMEECAELARENKARLIAVMHHNLIDHSKILNSNYTVDSCNELFKVFDNCGIEIVLTGHIHLQDIKTKQYDGKTLFDVATSSLTVYPHQYGVMSFKPGTGFDYNTVVLDMDGWAKQAQSEDEFLLNFEACSADFFIKQCGKMHQRCLSELKCLPEKERNIVLETIDDMNMMYFAGYRNEALDSIVNTEGFRILEKVPECFTKEYAMSILNDERADNNRLHIPINSCDEQCCGE